MDLPAVEVLSVGNFEILFLLIYKVSLMLDEDWALFC